MDIEEKLRLIEQYEENFADTLSAKVLTKPKLDIWMFLIPIIFVHYMNECQKYKDGRKAFREHYLDTKKQALAEANEVVQGSRQPNLDTLVKMAKLPENTQEQFAEVLLTLIEHYTELLQAKGADYPSLIQAAYRNKTNYLFFLNQLGKAEKSFNKALQPQLDGKKDEVSGIVLSMERNSEEIRRNEANNFFG